MLIVHWVDVLSGRDDFNSVPRHCIGDIDLDLQLGIRAQSWKTGISCVRTVGTHVAGHVPIVVRKHNGNHTVIRNMPRLLRPRNSGTERALEGRCDDLGTGRNNASGKRDSYCALGK